MTKAQNQKPFWYLDLEIRICLGFSVSDLGFNTLENGSLLEGITAKFADEPRRLSVDRNGKDGKSTTNPHR